MMEWDYIFVYGTLHNPIIRGKVLGKEVKAYTGLLKGFKKGTLTQEGIEYPIIRFTGAGADYITGDYFKVGPGDLKKLDEYEGEGYRREKVKLVNGLQAWVYCE